MKDSKNLRLIHKYFIRTAAAVLSLSVTGMLLSSCGGSGIGSSAAAASFAQVISGGGQACGGHVTAGEGLELVAKSGLEELYFDPASYSIAVKDTTKGKMWAAMPESSSHESGVSVFSATVETGGKVYQLNTQDNSVAFGAVSHTIENGVLTLNYVLAADGEAAAKTAETVLQGEVWLSFSARFSLEYGSLITEIDCSSIQTAPGLNILELDVLGSFGGSAAAQEGDFMLVPDGSGAVIHTDDAQALAEPVSLRVYGTDPAINSAPEKSALLGVFGVRQGDAAFCAIVEQGASCARIRAEKAAVSGSLNRVWPSFILQDSSVPAGTQAETSSVSVSSSRYQGKIRVCYRFLSDSNASYAGMAIACREQLIRDGALSNISVEQEGSLPFLLTTVGNAEINGKSEKLTTYAQAQDMVRQLKAKGVDNLYLRYMGALSGGIGQKDLANVRFPLTFGGKGDFEELTAYIDSQNLRVFLDVNLLTASSRISGMSKASGADGRALLVSAANPFSALPEGGGEQTNALTAGKAESSLMDFLDRMRAYPAVEYSFNDAGRLLYSDYSGSGTDRETFAATISGLLEKAAYDRDMMVDTGNLYALKNTDFVANLPLTCFYEESSAYEAVPFVQMILHGTLEYAGTPVNLSGAQDIKYAMLRSVEYGACPSYLWVSRVPEAYSSASEQLSYEKAANDAAKFYIQVRDALSDLRGSRMTDHQEVAEGVYMTEYDSSSVVYVNYTEAAAEVDGVSVPAGGFIRIN